MADTIDPHTHSKPSHSALPIRVLPGILLTATVAALSLLIAMHLGGPSMLYALVGGMAFSNWASNPALKSGIKFSADTILKLGIILLGARLTLLDISSLGGQTIVLVIGGVTATLSMGWLIGRWCGLSSDLAILCAGGVAICGCSAALAISSVLPKTKQSDANTAMVVIAVTLLSTLAMVLYPLITTLFALGDTEAGIFMGVTIHNAPQAIGAGYMLSDGAGETATIVKLMRVACLVPALVCIGLVFRGKHESCLPADRPPVLPIFLIGFVALVIINSMGLVPAELGAVAGELSSWAMLTAIAAIGAKTAIGDIAHVGAAPIAALGAQTVFLAGFALVAISLVF